MEPHERLTPRELEIAILIGKTGWTNWQIGKALCLEKETVVWFVHQILLKLELKRRTQIAIYTWNYGLVTESHTSIVDDEPA